MTRQVALISLLVLLASCAEAGTGVARPTAEHSEVYVAVVQALLTKVEAGNEVSGRIWVPAYYVAGNYFDPPPVSLALREALEDGLPGVLFVEDWRNVFNDLFDCPHGRRATLGGNGCPILEDGVVVFLAAIERDGAGAVEVLAELIQSMPYGAGQTDTWSTEYRIRLIREAEAPGWGLAEIVLLSES